MRISDWSSDVCSSDRFCAGNHDAQRSATKKFHEHQQALQRRLCSRDALNESYLSGELGALVQDKFGNFIEFDEYFRREQPKVNDGVIRVEQEDGLPVDIDSLNTSLMKIGRASWRQRVCKSVQIWGV